jgi:opacity protein-like surface antigen
MKKLLCLFCLLPMLATVSFAQESRQDVSLSAVGTFQPTITGNAVTQSSTIGKGGLVSYRFMLTPSSAIEGNYQYTEFDSKMQTSFNRARVHARMQEMTAAYVRSFVYKNFNPFAEVGTGLLFFTPIDTTGTTDNSATRVKAIPALLGVGIAYELSPSWDLRAEYRGFILKSVDFGIGQYNANRYYWLQQPTIGVAYHF